MACIISKQAQIRLVVKMPAKLKPAAMHAHGTQETSMRSGRAEEGRRFSGGPTSWS